MLNEYPPCVDTEFAHTHDYADYWGVFFYARSTDGDWIDRLDISATYTDPIFDSIMHRFWCGKCPIAYRRSRVSVAGVESLSTVGINDGCSIPRRAA